ncbi:MAG: DUF6286 domain-containing protein [Microthrixaceae bacterium]
MMRVVIPVVARLVAALTALAVVVLGALVAIEAVAAWIGSDTVVLAPDTVDTLSATAWSDPGVRWTVAGLTAAGALLLAVALWHRPPLTIDSRVDGVRLERHSMERTLGRRLDRVDGVSSTRVRAGRRALHVRVDTLRRVQPEQVATRAEDEVSAFCDRFGLDLTPKVSLRERRSSS